MKKMLTITILMFCITFLLIGSVANAIELSASDYILIYNQDKNGTWSNKSLNTSDKNRTLSSSGCGLYAIAHAVQWLTGNKRTSSNGGELLDTLIKINNRPFDGLGSYYTKYMQGLGIRKSSKPSDQAGIISLFDKGGVIVGNPSGHFDLAIGYTWHDVNNDGKNDLLIHMVDSRMDASMWKWNDSTQKYVWRKNNVYEFSSFKQITSSNSVSSWHKGGQYWMDYNNFKSIATSYVYLPPTNYLPPVNHIIEPESIQLNTISDVLYLNNNLNLSASIYPSNASQSITWTSSNTSIATVSNGIVTPIAPGNVTITATSSINSNIKATCNLQVKYNGTGSITFTNIVVPKYYKYKNNKFDWLSGSGTISDDVNLSSIIFKIYESDGTVHTYTKNNINAKSITMESMNSMNILGGITHSGLTYFQITATDVLGRSLSRGEIFTSDGSGGSTMSTHANMLKINTGFNDPELKDTTSLNGHQYVRYLSTYTWNEAKEYAEKIGGHLATITSAEENAAIYSLVKKDNLYGAWIGCYRTGSGKNDFSWITGEPFTFSNWYTNDSEPNQQWNLENYGAMRITEGQWRDSCNTNNNWKYFIVEFDPKLTEQILLTGETALFAGDNATVTATVLPETAENQTVTYTSSNPSVATINATTGVITAIAEGETTIIATAQDGSNVTGSYTVYVQHKHVPATGLTIYTDNELYNGEKEITVVSGQSFNMYSTVIPANADDTLEYYYSTNEEIARVEDYSNEIVALKEGTCEIVGVTFDSEITDRITVHVLSEFPYILNNGLATITEYNGQGGEITVPAIIDNYQVAAIGSSAFADRSDITSVIISEGIEEIGTAAFSNCPNLAQVALPSSLIRIGGKAFYDCTSLTAINLPDNLKAIGSEAFFNCKLTQALLPIGLETLGSAVFEDCLQLENTFIPDTLSTIPEGTFYGCTNLSAIEVPDSVQSIGWGAFYNCRSLKYIYLPDSITMIEDFALANIHPEAEIHVFRKSYAAQNIFGMHIVYIDSVMDAPDLQLPTGLVIIEEEAFAGNPAEWIKLSAKVTTIGPRAFADCKNLTEIYIPETATSISATAFEGVPAGLTIYTESGSYAAFYATNNGYDVHILPSKTAAQ